MSSVGDSYVPASAGGDRGSYINGSLWVLAALAGVFLGLRVYCKIFRHRGLWWDDYLLVFSWIFLAVSGACTSANVTIGFGKHFVDVNLANLELMSILSLLSGFFSILSSVLAKTSFAITLLRLTEGWLKRIIWCIIVSMNILMPLSALFLFVSCNPPEKNWKPATPGTCWPESVSVIYGIVVGAYSASCDLALALLPWRILMRFRMYRREKIGVAIAMSMGVFACATGIVKCVMLPLLGSADFTYDGAPFVVWGFAECAVAIMAASIPALRALVVEIRGGPPFIQRMIPSLRISHTHVTKPPEDGTGNTTISSPGDGPDNGTQHKSQARSSIHAVHSTTGQQATTAGPARTSSTGSSSGERKRDDRSDKSILAQSGMATADVFVVETEEGGHDHLGENDIEMNARRHSYNLQDV